jgi:hypothetical protein
MSPTRTIDAAPHAPVATEKSHMRRIPASGNAALVASALIQAALGVEFFLSGLNKFADPTYVRNFRLFVDASPGSHTGLLAPLVHAIVQPNIAFFAELTKFIELSLGIVLLLGAIEVGRRRLAGRIAAQHGYEAPVALVAALAGLVAAGLSLSIALLMGQQLPTITPGRALTTAIPVEQVLVPLGIAVAWMEFGRFRVLVRHSRLDAAREASSTMTPA